MNRAIPAALAVLLAVPAVAADAELKTDEQKTLYTLGAFLGRNLEGFSLTPAELRFVEQGMGDAALGKALKADMNTYGPKVNELQKQRFEQKAAKEKAKAKTYLDQAKKEKGAQVLANGAIVIPVKEGTGASPKASDKVKVHYHGTLTDGTVFDSSVQRGQPIDFPLTGVIPCWTEGVQKIKVGGKAKLVCPSDIAYGDRGSPPKIPGGATLVFEVELLDIVK